MQPGQGSGRNGDHYLFRPSGVPADAAMFVDFIGQHAWRGMAAPFEFEGAFTCDRDSTGFALGGSGGFMSFGADEPRRTDLGLLVEPEATNLNPNFRAAAGGWSQTAGGTQSVGAADAWLEIFVAPLEVLSGGSANARSASSGIAVVSGATYYLTYWYKAGTSGRVRLTGNEVGQAGYSHVAGTVATVSASSGASKGTIALVDVTPMDGGYRARCTWVPNFTGTGAIGMGPDSATIGETVQAFGAQMEISGFTSPVPTAGGAATRAADAVTVFLPDGAYDLTFNFDDDSTQTIAGQSGNYVIPTDLDRAVIKSLKAVAA